IVGDAKEVLPKLTKEYRATKADPDRLNEWWDQLHASPQEDPLTYEDSEASEIKPQRMIQAMDAATGAHAIITTDACHHQMWCAQYYDFSERRRWINSGGLGTMGFGLRCAIGAKVAMPDEQVVCVAGDGSLIMTCQELATAVRHEIPVKVFLMNNG